MSSVSTRLGRIFVPVAGDGACPPTREPGQGQTLGTAEEIPLSSSKRSGHSTDVEVPSQQGKKAFYGKAFSCFPQGKSLSEHPDGKEAGVGDSGHFFISRWASPGNPVEGGSQFQPPAVPNLPSQPARGDLWVTLKTTSLKIKKGPQA